MDNTTNTTAERQARWEHNDRIVCALRRTETCLMNMADAADEAGDAHRRDTLAARANDTLLAIWTHEARANRAAYGAFGGRR